MRQRPGRSIILLFLAWQGTAFGQIPMPIAEAARVLPSGAALHERQSVTVDGTATVGTGVFYEGTPQKIFVQDDTGGIALFTRGAMPRVTAGDRVRAVGTVRRYNGTFEIDVRDVVVTGHGATPPPVEVEPADLLSSRYSGRLVETTSVVVGYGREGRAWNATVRAGERVLQVHLTQAQLRRLTSVQSLFEAGATLRIRGIASQYDPAPPFDSGWQILPRNSEDLVLLRTAPLLTVHDLLVGSIATGLLVVLCIVGLLFLRRQVAAERRRLAASEARYRTLFERSVAGLYTTALEGRIVDCNDAVARLLGATRAEIIGRSVRDFYADKRQLADVTRALDEKGAVSNLEIALRRCDGAEIWVLATATVVENPGREPLIDGALIDITDRRRAVAQMEYLAYHDAMTGLPNRALFRDHLELQLVQARRDAAPLAVLFLDIDRFKRINDSLGHSAGDELLKSVANRLRTNMRGSDTVARLGGDEFAILSRVRSADAAETVAAKVMSAIRQPFEQDGRLLHVTASIGVAIHPADGDDCEILLKNADQAMYRAKDSGRNTFEFASSLANAGVALDRLSLENDLRRVLQTTGLEVWFQPQVSTMTGRVIGAEALARWRHPTRGDVPPSDFIPIAEEIGVIDVLGKWVLGEACRVATAWRARGLDPGFRVAVNVSAHQLRDEHFPDRVAEILRAADASPDMLELEITESAALSKHPHTIPALERLRAFGFGISIDDFGTGHATLTNMRQLPVTTIKVDSSFVSSIDTDANDAAIVAGLIDMAHHLSCRVVAEGVETEAQLEFLRSRRCDAYQGFLFSRAVPADQFEVFLVRGEVRDAATL